MSVFRLITAAKKQIIRGRLLIQCELHERNTPREITLLIDKSFSFFPFFLLRLLAGAGKWKLKGEQGCGEPIVAELAAIGSQRGPASRGLIWEFTGASRISLRHISLMNLNTARIRRVFVCTCVCVFTHPSCCLLLMLLPVSCTELQQVLRRTFVFARCSAEACRAAAVFCR